MKSNDFTPGFVLGILFDNTTKGQKYFADFYINRDRTLVYKWINDTAILPKKHVPDVVRFVLDHTSPSVRLQIKSEIQHAIYVSCLCEESKSSLFLIENFDNYLSEVLLHAISMRITERHSKQSIPAENHKEVPYKEKNLVSAIVYAFLVPITGGILWNIFNHIFCLRFFMGGSGNEPSGITSIIWGVLTAIPVIVFSLLSLEQEITPINARTKGFLIFLYSLGGGLGAFVFYNSGFRNYIESFGLAYGYQECIIAGFYALVVSNFPLVVLFPVFRLTSEPLKTLFILILLPLFATVLAVLGTWLVNRPEIEIAQLRGFLVGIVLRLCMFVVVRIYLAECSKNRLPVLLEASLQSGLSRTG